MDNNVTKKAAELSKNDKAKGRKEDCQVWDKEGNMHTVDHLNFHDLIQNCGYSTTKPEVPEQETAEDKEKRILDSMAKMEAQLKAIAKEKDDKAKEEALALAEEEKRKEEVRAKAREAEIEEAKRLEQEEAEKKRKLELAEKVKKEEEAKKKAEEAKKKAEEAKKKAEEEAKKKKTEK